MASVFNLKDVGFESKLLKKLSCKKIVPQQNQNNNSNSHNAVPFLQETASLSQALRIFCCSSSISSSVKAFWRLTWRRNCRLRRQKMNIRRMTRSSTAVTMLPTMAIVYFVEGDETVMFISSQEFRSEIMKERK